MSKEAMKLALEALEKLVRFESDSWELGSCRIAGQATRALREALASEAKKPDFWEGYVPEPVKSGEGASATVTITLPAPRVVDCHATGVCVQSGLQAEQPAPVQQEPTVSKGAYNRVRDDYNDLLKQSEQDAKDAKEWRAHVNRCKLAGIDLDYQITASQPAQQEYASFAEWAHDYVQDNLHKLKPAQQEPVACECHRCIDEKGLNVNGLPLSMTKMILCPKCGNKRCPKASDHRLTCTNSNDPGQPGSIYTSPPAQRTWVGLVWGELPEDGQNHDFLRGAVWAETKLKEKNT